MRPILGVLAAGLVGGAALAQDSANMKISSPSFRDGEMIPARFTADSLNVNPELHITGVPAGTRCLVLIVDDPDAPAGTWNHWLLWNIDPATDKIAENSVPSGAIAGRNDFGKTGYLGPSPPSGTHRYFFRLFALDTAPELPAGASRAELDKALRGRVLAEATLMGRYRRMR